MFRLVPHRPRVGTVADRAVRGQQAASAASVWALNEIQTGFVAFAVFTLWVLTSGDIGLPCVFCGVHGSCLVSEDPGQKYGNRNVSKCKVSRFFFLSAFSYGSKIAACFNSLCSDDD